MNPNNDVAESYADYRLRVNKKFIQQISVETMHYSENSLKIEDKLKTLNYAKDVIDYEILSKNIELQIQNLEKEGLL